VASARECRHRVFGKPTPLPGIWDSCSPSETGMGLLDRQRRSILLFRPWGLMFPEQPLVSERLKICWRANRAVAQAGISNFWRAAVMGSSPHCRLGSAASFVVWRNALAREGCFRGAAQPHSMKGSCHASWRSSSFGFRAQRGRFCPLVPAFCRRRGDRRSPLSARCSPTGLTRLARAWLARVCRTWPLRPPPLRLAKRTSLRLRLWL
jgi:hypothetical protein